MFQNFGLVPHFTALENIAFPLKVRGESKNEAMAKAEEMLNLVGLEAGESIRPSFPAANSNVSALPFACRRSRSLAAYEPFSALDR